MMPNNLDWEEGYRAAVIKCLKLMLKIKDADELWDRLAQLHEESAVRTERILQKMEESQ